MITGVKMWTAKPRNMQVWRGTEWSNARQNAICPKIPLSSEAVGHLC